MVLLMTAVTDESSAASAATFYGTLANCAGDTSNAAAIIDGDCSLTYGQLHARADEQAAWLHSLGIRRGDRVVLWLPNGVTWMATFFACARLGAVSVMANTRLRMMDIAHIAADSAAVVLLYSEGFLGIEFQRMVDQLRSRHALMDFPASCRAVPVQELPDPSAIVPVTLGPPADEPSAAATVCYTSGTTGAPKGCVHDHGTLIRNGECAADLSGLCAEDRIVCPVPFSHVFGFHMGVLQCTLAGATLINAEPYSAGKILDLAERHRATVLYLVPAMAAEVLAEQQATPRDISALRLAVIAGAPVGEDLRHAVESPRGLDCLVTVVYGCTEAPTIAQLCEDDPREARSRSVGRATPGVEVRIALPQTTESLPADQTGDILVRGYNHMRGYLGDAQGTARKYRSGWLVTGDAGSLDKDGYLHIEGRASDMMIVGGFNVYPREVEAQVERCPGVREAAVTAAPDSRLGEVPVAFVVVDRTGPEAAEIMSWVQEHMASYKRPRNVWVVDSLPRTVSGKLERSMLEADALIALGLPIEEASLNG